ncbi:hypothetical protein GCM10009776_12280 [Microbacterium deminutum]|uniref:NADH-ubiquinone oxidoreductase n=2 Tax=Microbacterium deminutum TaxID=344164 RepID=A0ABN2QGY8_9MICO
MIGSACFALGVVPAYAAAVGPVWDSATFFLGSLFFTTAGFIQLALSGRRPPRNAWRGADAADWWAAAIQFVGTILFNVSTVTVLIVAANSPAHEFTGWRPDAWGSIAFLVSSTFALVAASRRHELWDPMARTFHGTMLNMVGSIAFGISAVGAYVYPASGDLRNLAWANLGTFVGAVCFFVAALLARRSDLAGEAKPATA